MFLVATTLELVGGGWALRFEDLSSNESAWLFVKDDIGCFGRKEAGRGRLAGTGRKNKVRHFGVVTCQRCS